jgi:AraC-like DNA-binding protein
MLYLDDTVLEQLTGERGWWFAEATDRDATRARRVSRLLRQLWHANEPLAFDGLLLNLIDEFRPSACVAQPARNEGLLRFAPVLDYLRANLAQRVTLDELAAVAGLSPFHFLRQFKRAHHATPQQMLMALRLFEAKQMLAGGEAPAQVAAAVGLTDQAHLTHAFANRYGVTPARYQQQLGTRPKRGA